MNIPAQIISLLGIVSNIIGIQLKTKKHILISFIIANLLFGIAFILLESYSGAVICLVAALQTIIKYLFDKNNKKFPMYLVFIYIIVSITCGILTYRELFDILPVICSVLYTLSIIQNKESNLRVITLINIILWTVYDFIVGAYTAGINDIFLTISTVIAIVRYDVLLKNKEEELIRRLVNFNTYCNKGFLVSDIIDLNNGKFVYSSTIGDSFWNFITGINVNSKKEFERVWKENREYMLEKDKVPTLYITPESNLINKYEEVLPSYMKVEAHEVWMILDDFNNIEKIEESKLNIKVDSKPKLEVFADAFMKSYSAVSEDSPYGEMPEYYRETIINSSNNKSDYKRTFYVGYLDNKPIASTLTVEKDNIALIGFVGTIPEYRKKGVCKSLMKQVLTDLKKKKVEVAFLQTEEGFIPEKIYSNIGFRKVGKAIIAIEKK